MFPDPARLPGSPPRLFLRDVVLLLPAAEYGVLHALYDRLRDVVGEGWARRAPGAAALAEGTDIAEQVCVGAGG